MDVCAASSTSLAAVKAASKTSLAVAIDAGNGDDGETIGGAKMDAGNRTVDDVCGGAEMTAGSGVESGQDDGNDADIEDGNSTG